MSYFKLGQISDIPDIFLQSKQHSVSADSKHTAHMDLPTYLWNIIFFLNNLI